MSLPDIESLAFPGDDSPGKAKHTQYIPKEPKRPESSAAHTCSSDGGVSVKRSRKQMLLRLDPDVYAAVAKWASDDLRSVNAQIEVLLRRSLKEAGRDPHAAPLRPRGRPRQDQS